MDLSNLGLKILNKGILKNSRSSFRMESMLLLAYKVQLFVLPIKTLTMDHIWSFMLDNMQAAFSKFYLSRQVNGLGEHATSKLSVGNHFRLLVTQLLQEMILGNQILMVEIVKYLWLLLSILLYKFHKRYLMCLSLIQTLLIKFPAQLI